MVSIRLLTLCAFLFVSFGCASSLYRRKHGAELGGPTDDEPSTCQLQANDTRPIVDEIPEEQDLKPLDDDESYYLFNLFEQLGLVDGIDYENGNITQSKYLLTTSLEHFRRRLIIRSESVSRANNRDDSNQAKKSASQRRRAVYLGDHVTEIHGHN